MPMITYKHPSMYFITNRCYYLELFSVEKYANISWCIKWIQHTWIILFKSTPLYWPTTTEEPTILEQLSVTLLKDEVLEEGILNVKDFEIALEQKVKFNCYIHIIYIYIVIKVFLYVSLDKAFSYIPVVWFWQISKIEHFVPDWLYPVWIYLK